MYAHSVAVIALYNAGVQIERRHVERLLSKQKADGSYMYGAGRHGARVDGRRCLL